MQFKNLEPEDILISPFEVNKTFTVTNVDSGSGVYAIPITKGSDSNLYGFTTSAASSKVISALFIPTAFILDGIITLSASS